jgi:hypothetical protein
MAREVLFCNNACMPKRLGTPEECAIICAEQEEIGKLRPEDPVRRFYGFT